MLLEVTGLIIFNLRHYIDENPVLLDQIFIAKRAAICRLTLRRLLRRTRMSVRLNRRRQIAAQLQRRPSSAGISDSWCCTG
jgi:hypothetical protein